MKYNASSIDEYATVTATAQSSIPDAFLQNTETFLTQDLSNESTEYIFHFGITHAGQD